MRIFSRMLVVVLLLVIPSIALITMATMYLEMLGGQQPKSKPLTVAMDGSQGRKNTVGAAAPKCGVERVNIKNLNSDEGKQLMYALAVPSTVAGLASKKAPSRSYLQSLENERVLPDEQTLYRIDADVIGYKLEGDSDFHIVIADHGTKSPTMIVEIPLGACSPVWAGAFFDKERSQFKADFGRPVAAFHRLTVPKRATVTGVFFFDFLHGQTGVAPNGAELHPVLEIAPR